MSDARKTDGQGSGQAPVGSDMNPPVVKPLSDGDPSVTAEWNEHVQEYFNEDSHQGEPIPTATHEAKE